MTPISAQIYMEEQNIYWKSPGDTLMCFFFPKNERNVYKKNYVEEQNIHWKTRGHSDVFFPHTCVCVYIKKGYGGQKVGLGRGS